MKNARLVLAPLLLVSATPCIASDETLDLLTPNAMYGDPLVARIGSPGCSWLPVNLAPVVQGNVVRFSVGSDDACDADVTQHTRDYPIGVLAPGEYTVELENCHGDLLYGYKCSIIATAALKVSGGVPTPVPLLGGFGSILLAGSLIALTRFFVR